MKHFKLFFALFAMLALNVGNAWGAESLQVTLDFTTNSWGFPSGSSNKTATEKTYTSGDYSIILAGGGNSNGHYFNSNGYLMLGKSGATLTLPAFDFNTTKIVVTGKSGASTSVKQNIYVGSNAVSTETTGATGTNIYTINAANQAAGNVYILKVTSAHNTQITKIEVYGESNSTEPPTPTTQYTIKWHTAKGVTTDVTLNEGATITKPATDPTMTDYEFMGWTEDCEVASDGTGFTAISNFGTATEDKDYYAVFAVATTTGGGGETATTGSVTMKYSGATTSNMTEGNNAATVGLDANEWSVIPTKGSASNMPGLNKDGDIRLYGHASGGNYLTISSESYTITSVEITYTSDSYNNGKFYVNGTETTASNINANEFVIKNANSGTTQVRIKELVINYASGSAGTTTYSEYITTCASDIEFVELGDAFKWSATEAEVTIDATDNVFPTLTNTHNVPVTYSSTDDAIASIAADGTVTLKTEGTVTITAKYEGGISAGTGKEYKSKTVTYSLKVNKAVAQPTGTMYVKVTDAVTDGEYLIVYEAGNVAFDGSLATLDVAGNMIETQINSNTIAGNTEIDAATFTIASMTDGHSIQSKSGKYIGRTASGNGMNTGSSAILNIISITNGAVKVAGSGSGASASLQYFSQSGSERFRYYTSAQKAIALYKKVDPNAVVEPVFTPVAGEYYGTQSVTISCATAGAEVYYTLDGTDPTSASTKYTGAISIASTTTVKAIAVKGENSSAVVSATYTILAPLATMQEIFDKATAVGGTATPVHITMNNWVVTGVKNNNAYVTDGTKGLIIYNASHGFKVDDILSGTVACKVQLYNGSSELTELTSTTEGLTVTTGGVVTPVVVNDVTTLGGVNTGSVIKITGPCTVDGTKYYVAGVQLYNSLYTYTNPEDGYNYECTGVYLQYNTTKEILPRKAEDLVKIETQEPAGIKFETTEYTANVNEAFTAPTLTNPNGLTVTYSTSDATLATVNTNTGAVTIGNKTGKVTITASFAGNEDYVAATASYNITISDPSLLEATFDATVDLGNTARGEGEITKSPITFACTDGILGNSSEYRLYQNATISFTAENGYAITKVVITSTASGTSQYGPGHLSTENGTYSVSDKTGTWVGEAQTVTFTATAQSRAKLITVYYKTDNRQDAGLVWNTENVSITLGDAFTAPTLSNPNGLTLTCTSDNENLATVTNAGVVTLKSGVTGKATITAKFDGNSNYKDATVTCTITVNPKTEIVVILAQYNGQWYALKNVEETAGKVLAALPVNYVGGKLYNVEEADKATIEWQRAAVTDGIIFKNGENYIYGTAGSTDLKLSTTECAWTLDGSTYKIGNRTFIYRAQANGFKNYNATTTPGTDDYSNLPVVTAPVYTTGDAYGRTVTTGEYGTICIPYGSSNYTGAKFYEVSWLEVNKGLWLDEVNGTLVAGKPYIFLATASEIAILGDGNTAVTPEDGVGGLTGTFTDIAANGVLVDNYIIAENNIWIAGTGATLPANRAYISATLVPTTEQSKLPGRRRVCMGENAATGFENIVAPEGQAVKAIVNGQLIIIRDGVKYNVQGVRL